uniref:Ig-like domain-containing protein n=1 Tax=Cyprinus carpio TaxID=7962 RepID=A0A8C1Y7G8_CYPCA
EKHFLPGVICQDWIRPSDQRTSVSSTEGESVTLECSYDTSSSYVILYWYRQFSNTQPEFVLAKGGRSQTYENIPDPNQFGTTTSQKSTSLTIKSVTLSDSALYYFPTASPSNTQLGVFVFLNNSIE